MRTSILIMFHCKQDTGYAISSLEKAFKQAATEAGFSEENILWSYKEVADKEPQAFQLDYYSENDAMNLRNIIEEYQISTILAFDLPYPSPVVRAARAMNVEKVVAYWGASMSSINSGLKLFLRRFQWILQARSAPDFFIFESNAMLRTATHGRGVPKSRTTVIPLGVNTDTYYPDPHDRSAYRLFNIPETRKIIFYSGHMEERKGVRVLINAMLELEKRKKLEPFHLLICGNKGNQSEPYESMLQSSQALEHVTFAGYRKDVPQLMRSAYIGTIASTGWDSFTMSSVEMLSSGLPLIVSELQGLKETIDDGVCGYSFPPGNSEILASLWQRYLDDPKLHHRHSKAARLRAVTNFSIAKQVERIGQTLSTEFCYQESLHMPKEGHQ